MVWKFWFRIKEFLKSSLWLVPVVGVFMAMVLQRKVGYLDSQWESPVPLTFTPSTAGTLLSAIVGASMSLTGFMLTILVLVVQISGSTYSPRTLMFVFRNQELKLSLAFFTGTMTFAFFSMGEITETSANDLSVIVCAVMFLFSVLFFLHTLSQLMHGIRPSNLADQVITTGRNVIDAMYPHPAPSEQGVRPEELIPTEPANRTIASGHDGAVLQSIDIEGLKHLAIRHDALIVMPMAVGDYLRKNSMVFALYGGASLPDDEQMLDHLALGSERSPEQDPTLALRVLVDISIKALSPAINDPTTGDHMLDRVEDLLVDMVQRDLDAGIVRDANNIPRLIYPTPTWEDVLQLGVTEIRLYGGSNPQICRRLHALYDNLLAVAPAYRRDSIEAERARLLRTIASQFPDPLDRELAMVSDTQGFGARGLLGAVRPPV